MIRLSNGVSTTVHYTSFFSLLLLILPNISSDSLAMEVKKIDMVTMQFTFDSINARSPISSFCNPQSPRFDREAGSPRPADPHSSFLLLAKPPLFSPRLLDLSRRPYRYSHAATGLNRWDCARKCTYVDGWDSNRRRRGWKSSRWLSRARTIAVSWTSFPWHMQGEEHYVETRNRRRRERRTMAASSYTDR